jgi:hypothetical protein
MDATRIKALRALYSAASVGVLDDYKGDIYNALPECLDEIEASRADCRDYQQEVEILERQRGERMRKALEFIASSPDAPLYPAAECVKLRQVARAALAGGEG